MTRLRALPENAQRWVARCEDDENSCAPCKNNGGRTYRNRQAAYTLTFTPED